MSQTHERRPPSQVQGAATTSRPYVSTPRRMRPRAPIVVAAAYVSQLTSAPLLGIDARRFLDVLVPACRPDVIHVGKLRLVELARAVEALRAMATENDDSSTETEHDDDQPATADQVLAALGMERVS